MGKKKINLFGITLSIFTLFLIGYMGISFVNQSIEIRKYKSEIEDIKRQIQVEEKEIKGLEEDYKNYKKDEYVEKIAREKLKMVKPGEIIYIDVDKKGE